MINAILAVDKHGGIGHEGKMPWPHNKEDMKWFQEHTTGHTIVMGRRTWESIGRKALPNRKNIVVSSKIPQGKFDGWIKADEAVPAITNIKEVYIIGGAMLFNTLLPHIDRIYLTRFPTSYPSDTRINTDDIYSRFELVYWDNRIKDTRFEIHDVRRKGAY